ncbi:MAG: hypothetical protein ACLQPH_22300 [Acidimicrobiales bacterium]
MSPKAEQRAVDALEADLRSGRWDDRLGHFRRLPHYDGAIRLVVGH